MALISCDCRVLSRYSRLRNEEEPLGSLAKRLIETQLHVISAQLLSTLKGWVFLCKARLNYPQRIRTLPLRTSMLRKNGGTGEGVSFTGITSPT